MESTADIRKAKIVRYQQQTGEETWDNLAVEEPLEIRVIYGPENQRVSKNISITMRTPGADEDLAAGFLFTEGIIQNGNEITQIRHFEKLPGVLTDENVIIVELNPDSTFDLSKLERNFYTTSSCGVCGKASIDAIRTVSQKNTDAPAWQVAPDLIYALPEIQRQAQLNFESTGGLHASALFDLNGQLLGIREDVGRHNALDKLIGHFVKQNTVPLSEQILLLSGRASFELLQKSAMAGIQMVCAVGAPSSLAAETAAEFGITLIGFLKAGRFNVYSAPQRISNL